MWFFSKKSELVRALDSFAVYNDKGIDWSRHTLEQTANERRARLANVQTLVAAIGRDSLPHGFLSALDSGEVANDATGRYVDLVKEHFRRVRAA